MNNSKIIKELGPTPFLKYKDREIDIPCAGSFGLGGWFRLEAYYPYLDASAFLTPWFHNNITNSGLNMMASATKRFLACQVGSGTTEPENTDTTLAVFKAGTTSVFQNTLGSYVAGPPPYIQSYIIYQFGIDAVTGNITEVGVGSSASSGSTLYSRELIRDANGNPVTVTLPANSQLRVHYKHRTYPPTEDVVGEISGTLYGDGATRVFTRRASQINFSASQYRIWGSVGSDLNDTSVVYVGFNQVNNPTNVGGTYFSTNGIGVITAAPGGTTLAITTGAPGSYTPDSFTRTGTYSCPNGTAMNVKSFRFGARFTSTTDENVWPFQVEFDTVIPKTTNDALSVGVQYTWGRYTE